MQHTHGRSRHRTPLNQPTTESSGIDDLLPIVQPMLVYTGLIEQLQCFFKVKKSPANAVVGRAEVGSSSSSSKESGGGEVEGGSLEGWEVVMREKLLNVREMVGFSREVLTWLEDATSASDLQEAFDVIGVLADVLSGGFARCEDFVHAAINGGKS